MKSHFWLHIEASASLLAAVYRSAYRKYAFTIPGGSRLASILDIDEKSFLVERRGARGVAIAPVIAEKSFLWNNGASASLLAAAYRIHLRYIKKGRPF